MVFEKQIIGIYNMMMGSRQDPTGDIYYFDYTDFPGMCAEPFEFKGNVGQALRGKVYYFGEKCKEKITVFDHGMGNGHRAYMREIVELTRHGYTVIAYDHTGCRDSEGESIRGFAQSLADLDHCLKYLKTREDFKGASISVIGHSWGSFSTMNIPALHPEVTHIVGMSGFISVPAILEQFFSGILKGYRPAVYKIEEERNPEYVGFDAITSIKGSSTKAMYIQSLDDKTINTRYHFDKLRAALADRENTHFIPLTGRNHNPNYTEDAVKLLGDFQKRLAKFRKKNKAPTDAEKQEFVSGFDWAAITEQDADLWNRIFDFLDN